MEDLTSPSAENESPPLLHTLVKFHTRFCSESSFPQPMDLDDQTLLSNPLSTFPEDELPQTLAINNAFGRGEIRTRDLDRPADVAVDMASIFRVWDLNTESPELENGTLTDILTALVTKTENCWFDEGQGFVTRRPSTDAFDLTEMRSVLEAQMMERSPAADISVSALVRLFRSIL